MRISKQTNDAVRLLVHLARSDIELHSIPDIAEACEITKANAFKLVPTLVRAGFLETERGRGGGVKLGMKPAEISVGAVVRQIEEMRNPVDEGGVLETMVDDAFEAFLQILDENTIADLAADRKLSGSNGATCSADKIS